MVNVRRARISTDFVRVSQPGIDIDLAKLDELTFDSDFASVRQCQRGAVTILGSYFYSGSSAGFEVAPGSAFVAFPIPYEQPPTVVFAIMDYVSGKLLHPFVTLGMYVSPSNPWNYNRYPFATVYTTGIQFTNNFSRNTGSGYIPGPPNSTNSEGWYNEIRWIAVG